MCRAIPNAPYSNSFDAYAIDQDVLKQWCSKNGLKAALLTEKEDPKNFKRGFPSMRFWRSGNPTLNQSEPNELMQY